MAPKYAICVVLDDTITWGCALCLLPISCGNTRRFHTRHPQGTLLRFDMEYMKTKERKGGLIEHGLGDQAGIARQQLLNIETAVYYRLQC